MMKNCQKERTEHVVEVKEGRDRIFRKRKRGKRENMSKI